MGSGVQIMFSKREDEIRRHLSGAMEGGLPATERFVEFSFTISPEVGFLLGRKRTDLSPAAGVCGRGLEGEEDGSGSRIPRLGGFVIQMQAN